MDKINKLNNVTSLLVVAAVALTVANAALLIITWLISQYYRQFFVPTHPFPIQAYDPRYVQNWRSFFLEPFLLLLQFGMDWWNFSAFNADAPQHVLIGAPI